MNTRVSRVDSFVQLMDGAYPELSALSPTKPLSILEWGIVESP